MQVYEKKMKTNGAVIDGVLECFRSATVTVKMMSGCFWIWSIE